MRLRGGGVVVLGALVLALGAAAPASAATLVVTHPTPGGGVITSDPPGLTCETFFCGAEFAQGSLVRLKAAPRKGFAFAGYSDDCTGPVCEATMDAERRVTVSFVRFGELPYAKPRQVRKDGSAVLTVRIGGPGRVVLSGSRVKQQVVNSAAAANVKLPVVGKGALARRMESNGSAPVRVRVAFTPTDGTRSAFSRSLRLVRGAR
jgi:hypothetical protein